MTVVDLFVSDTSVLIDLERGGLLEAALKLPHRILVSDHLYERELRPHAGDDLRRSGLAVLDLTGEQVELARAYRRETPALSWPAVFALAGAVSKNGTLLTGDRRLRELAFEKHVTCHSLLWLLDEMHLGGIANDLLHAALQTISAHPRCKLPRREVEQQLVRYAEAKPNGSVHMS